MNRRSHAATALVAAFAVIAGLAVTATTTHAQPRKDLAALRAEVAKLTKQVAELSKATVSVPTLTQTVQTLSVRIISLSNSLETLSRQQKTIPDAVALLDKLRLRSRAIQQELALLRTKVAGLEQTNMSPPAAGESTGGGASYSDGFVLSTADKRYRLRLSGFVQGRFAAVFNGELDATDSSGFSLARARAIVAAKIGAKVSVYTDLELQASPVLLDYYFDYKLTDTLVVRAGTFRTPFTRSFITHSARRTFPERSLATESLGFDRDIGVSLMGTVADNKVGYLVGLQNGAGRNKLNDNIDMLMLARADAALLGERMPYGDGDLANSKEPQLTIGVGVAHDLARVPDAVDDFTVNTDVDGDGVHDNVQVIMASADAVFRYMGFELLVEGVVRHERWGTIFDGQNDPVGLTLTDAVGNKANRTFVGGYGQATYFAVPKKVLVGLRAGYAKVPFLGVTGRQSTLAGGDKRFDLDALVSVFSRGHRFLSLQYTFSDVNPGVSQQHRLMVDAMVKW